MDNDEQVQQLQTGMERVEKRLDLVCEILRKVLQRQDGASLSDFINQDPGFDSFGDGQKVLRMIDGLK